MKNYCHLSGHVTRGTRGRKPCEKGALHRELILSATVPSIIHGVRIALRAGGVSLLTAVTRTQTDTRMDTRTHSCLQLVHFVYSVRATIVKEVRFPFWELYAFPFAYIKSLKSRESTPPRPSTSIHGKAGNIQNRIVSGRRWGGGGLQRRQEE